MQGSLLAPFIMILPEIKALSEILKMEVKSVLTPFYDQQADIIKLLG